MQYVDQCGRTITLGKKIGTGGEGSVYEIAGSPDFVAKVYHRPQTQEKAAKLLAMAQLATPQILQFAAWPKATLHTSRTGATIGIVLPRIKNAFEVHELYSPAHRKFRFPRADWRFLVRTARNCAAAFATLHDHNIVIGDINQGNVFVAPQATVSLIDCDSFQVSANGRLFRCPVGVAHFVPPELQNARLADVTRTVNHDGFGLAILIFHLLFMGRHPFAGRYSGQGDMPIERAISEYRFAYAAAAARLQMAPPPHSLTLTALPQEVGILFERAFARGSEHSDARPTAHLWAGALEQMERQLRQCQGDPGHFYSTHLRGCPWCDVIRNGGPSFFISVSIQTVVARSAAFDLRAIWLQIEAVPRPDQVLQFAARADLSRILPRSIPPTSDEGRPIRNAVGIISLASAALSAVGVFFPMLALFGVPLSITFAIWWIIAKWNSPLGKLKHWRSTLHRNKASELERARINQQAIAQRGLQQFQTKLESLRQLKRKYEQLTLQRNAELDSLQQHVRQRQLEEHLKNCFISSAHIGGIGPGRIAALESYGIETAYDVETWRIRAVPGFGEKTTGKLLSWRQQKEREFQFDPTRGIPHADLQVLEMKYAQQRSQCERSFQHGPYELQQTTNAAKAEFERQDAVVARLEFEAAQTKADLRIFENIPWWY